MASVTASLELQSQARLSEKCNPRGRVYQIMPAALGNRQGGQKPKVKHAQWRD